jgi:transcriptional regulator with XRE-family HTH domain
MDLINELLTEVTPKERQRVRDRMMLAARIDDALAEKGWTQKQLATALGKSPSEISKWLSGTHNFTTDTLSDLSCVLDVKLLCVKEESLAPSQPVVRYQTVMLVTGKKQGSANSVSFNEFYSSMGQMQPNG